MSGDQSGTDLKVVELALLQTTRDVIARNDSTDKFRNILDDGSAWYEIRYDDSKLNGLVLHYHDHDCDYKFPAGRWMQVKQIAGRIATVVFVLPLETLGFDDAITIASEIRTGLVDAGWRETRWASDISVKTIEENPVIKQATIGRWLPCGKAQLRAQMIISDAGQELVGTSVPFTAQRRVGPAKAEGEYLLTMELFLDSETRDRLYDLTQARRLAVNNDAKLQLPAQVWIDDPDWHQ